MRTKPLLELRPYGGGWSYGWVVDVPGSGTGPDKPYLILHTKTGEWLWDSGQGHTLWSDRPAPWCGTGGQS